ncbi:alpha/beta fold hydrolase [Nocardia harenae]|uniref:alpha/beta fold hydrolase n=1 Tax=Nocardia harenae TaxID=358707 RepID=UPI00082DC33B|nr:alpha/beta fold hydrolase [Nocardia harenae]
MAKIGKFSSAAGEARFRAAYDAVAARWPVPSTEHEVPTSFGSTYVRKSGRGSGAPIALLPGIGGNGQVWYPFVEELARDHVVLTPDVIGWAGRCEQTAPVRDTADIARWFADTLDGLGVERVHLAGNSLGAWLAGAVAVHRSDRLASLTLLEPSAGVFARPRLGLLAKFIVSGINPTPERMRQFNRWLMPRYEMDDAGIELAGAIAKFRMAMPWDRTFTDAQLAAIAAPTLVLFGAETVVADPEFGAARAREGIARAQAEIMPGVGHDLLWANPEQVIPRFLAFVESHEQARA